MAGGRGSAYSVVIAIVLAVAILAYVPSPFFVIAPGSAVDLGRRIVVDGHAPLKRHFYLTAVSLRRSSVLGMLEAFFPGTRLLRGQDVFGPARTFAQYQRVTTAQMDDSQHVAAYVAERAAGLRVPPPTVVIARFSRDSRATRTLRTGDRIVRVARHAVETPADVARDLAGFAPPARAPVEVERGGRFLAFDVPTIRTPRGPRLGIYVHETAAARLPVRVRFTFDDVGGSSGGLMFALAIYADLTGNRRGPDSIAGTGTIASDGTVGPIEGALQKLIAAKRAGARLFLVPHENYRDIAGDRDIAIVPVSTFGQALGVLR